MINENAQYSADEIGYKLYKTCDSITTAQARMYFQNNLSEDTQEITTIEEFEHAINQRIKDLKQESRGSSGYLIQMPKKRK